MLIKTETVTDENTIPKTTISKKKATVTAEKNNGKKLPNKANDTVENKNSPPATVANGSTASTAEVVTVTSASVATTSADAAAIVANSVTTVATVTIAQKTTPATESSYSTLRTGIIRLTPETMKCKLYCKGTACRYCIASTAWPSGEQALNGLYSSWALEDRILAMARPTDAHFANFALLAQFRAHNIATVFNLQCGGEHSFCGPPLLSESGFTYDPEFLMQNNIYYYNFAMPDFEGGSLEMILNVVKVMHFALQHGKVAIHCHAGLGRTGTLIACYLVWSSGCSANNAIDVVRKARPNSIQSASQINVVIEMERTLRSLAASLPYPPDGHGSGDNGSSFVLPLSIILANQRKALPNEEARLYSHVPKLMFLVCDRLLRLVFEEDGVKYSAQSTTSEDSPVSNTICEDDTSPSWPMRRSTARHNVRACTFGVLSVEWRNAFTHKGRAQVRYIMNLFIRLSAFPYDVNDRLRGEFRRRSLVGSQLDDELKQMDASQLVHLLNACLESIRRPYCTNAQLIRAMEWFAPRDALDSPPPRPATTDVCTCDVCSAVSVKGADELANGVVGGAHNRALNATWSRARIPPKTEAKSVSKTLKNSALIDKSQKCTMLEEKRRVDINEDWHCMVFHLLNVLSYLSGENYDVLTELISYWLTNDAYADVKAAVYCHMRELFARNMHQQEAQAAEYHKRIAGGNTPIGAS